MIVDALILAGGRSTRLGDSDKRKLRIDGATLVEVTIRAARQAGCREIVVVGDLAHEGVITIADEPPHAGPVAGIAAGWGPIRTEPGDAVLVLACDMPRVAEALPPLLAGFTGAGVVAVDRGRRQNLVFAVTPDTLAAALDGLPRVVDAPVRALLAELGLREVPVPDGSTDDIDTWDDAARFGLLPPTPARSTP